MKTIQVLNKKMTQAPWVVAIIAILFVQASQASANLLTCAVRGSNQTMVTTWNPDFTVTITFFQKGATVAIYKGVAVESSGTDPVFDVLNSSDAKVGNMVVKIMSNTTAVATLTLNKPRSIRASIMDCRLDK